MNIKDLERIEPEWVAKMEKLADTGEVFRSHEAEFRDLRYDNRGLIITAFHAGLRLRKELEQTTTTR
jgi:hypothetical protein